MVCVAGRGLRGIEACIVSHFIVIMTMHGVSVVEGRQAHLAVRGSRPAMQTGPERERGHEMSIMGMACYAVRSFWS